MKPISYKKFICKVLAFILVFGQTTPLIPHVMANYAPSIEETKDSARYTDFNSMYNTYSNMATSAEASGDYYSAVEYLKLKLEAAQMLGYTDIVISTRKRIIQLDPMTEVYALTQNLDQIPYYNQTNEPVAGAYFGRSQNDQNIAPMEQESALSFYIECLQESVPMYKYLISKHSTGDRVIQICYNMPNQNDTIAEILTEGANAQLIADMQCLGEMGTPFLLRIGGEMNDWQANPEQYKQAFIKIAQYARTYAPNVALVFSPNDISPWSNWDEDVMRYYPGDEYVDWVGISSYTRKDSGLEHMFYGIGDYSDPIHKLVEVVNTFGDRKPILISESGASYLTGGVDYLSYSQSQLEKLYTYANMVFPQVKGLIHFDYNSRDSNGDHYAMSSNDSLLATYKSTTTNSNTLLSSFSDQKTTAYVTADSYSDNLNVLSFAAFSAPVGQPNISVSYILDGTTISSGQSMPFICDIPVSDLSFGYHLLTVNFQGSNGFTDQKQYVLAKNTGTKVSIQETENGILPQTPLVAEEPDIEYIDLPAAILHTSYLTAVYDINSSSTLVSGSFPKGLGLYADGVIGGVPQETGTFEFVISTSEGEVGYSITVEAPTAQNVEANNDFDIIERVPTVDSNEKEYIFEVTGEFSDFLNVYLDGELLVKDVHYFSEEGSTKITIAAQTMSQLDSGSHTINAVFTTTNTTITPSSSSGSASSGTITTTNSSKSANVESVAQVFEKTVEPAPMMAMPFTDVAVSDWHYQYVRYMYDTSTFSGVTDTTYEPDTGMTRAMMAVVFYGMANKPSTNSANFSDVADGEWYADAVNWVSTSGIDDSVGNYRPNDLITREETAKMMYNFCTYQGIFIPLTTSRTPSDMNSVSETAKNAVNVLFSKGIFAGDDANNFNPHNTSTRAEISAMMRTFMWATV